jgi:hypothetical protein
MLDQDTKEWACDLLASSAFGNVRRSDRCQRMLRRAAERPAGRLTEVFEDAAELQAAYDFVEGSVAPEAILDSFAAATLRAARGEEFAYAIFDGSSLSLTDRGNKKGLGSVGKRSLPTRGLKVIDAIGVASDGTPIGLLDMQFWARGAKKRGSRAARRRSAQTEVRHWVDSIDVVAERMRRAGVVPWVLVDREGDCSEILRAAERAGGYFTIRASQYKRMCTDGKKRGSLIKCVGRQPVLGTHFVAVPKGPNRRERVATLDVRIARVVLSLPDYANGVRTPFETNVVWARERGTPPRGEERLEWMLFTNRPVCTYADAIAIVDSYCYRWRVEDFHRTWKRGRCRVEETQLREKDHVIRWATMLAAVAMRVERLKHLARTDPDAPATIELRPIEIEALKAAKRTRFMKRTETVPDDMPTIATAVLWIAQWGGYQGKSSGGPPGSTTIGRGLERLLVFAKGFELGLKSARE